MGQLPYTVAADAGNKRGNESSGAHSSISRQEDQEIGVLHQPQRGKFQSAAAEKQQKVKKTYRKLIDRVKGILDVAENAAALLSGELLWEVVELKHYIPLVEKVIDQTERRVMKGEQVPSEEKVYSIFEEHTELAQAGESGKTGKTGRIWP